MKRFAHAFAAAGAVTVLLGGCADSGNDATPPSTDQTNRLDVLSWWTSGSEAKALNVLFEDYKEAHPGVDVVNEAVAGGSGSNAVVALAKRLQAGDPPDSYQTFIGASLKEYAQRGRIADVSAAYTKDHLDSVLPRVVKDAVTVDGKQVGMPTGAHRSNMLWFNRSLLDKAGVAPPGAGYTDEAFLKDLATLKQAGVTPLCLGGKDKFTTAELFENILLGRVGSDGWSAIVNDRFDWNGSAVRDALNELGAVLNFADPAAATTTWDQATRNLATGGCAFESMNDSAYGELVTDDVNEGKDFGYTPYPGTDKQFLAVVDTFVVSQPAANGRNALDFLTTIGSRETTVRFNAVKGSVPVRSDVPLDSLSPYQQQSAAVLRGGNVLLSIVHGEAMSTAFQQGFYDAVSSYADHRDRGAFVKTLVGAVRDNAPPP